MTDEVMEHSEPEAVEEVLAEPEEQDWAKNMKPNAEAQDEIDTEPDQLEPVEMLGRDETRRVLHALLFVSDRAVSAERLAEALGDIDCDIVRNILAELRVELEEKNAPYILREIAGGYQLTTESQFAPYIRRLLQIKKRNRLSKAALETLAIVAYKQPCTRAEVESIRGVSVSYAFDLLQEKRLIKVAGVAEVPGRPRLYRTTDEFLIHFGIKSLKELPSVEELRETM